MKRIVYADYLRVIGILGVMGVHLCGNYLSQTPLYSNIWYQSTIFYSLTRSGVLLFVLVSGLLLLDRPQSIDKLPHRIERVMVPYIFWLLIYYLKMVFIDHTMYVSSYSDFIYKFIDCIFNPGYISIEFWYIYMITGFYLALPILQKWIEYADEKEIQYFLILSFIILILNYFHVHMMLLEYVNLFTGYLGFFVLGYYLNRKKSKYTDSFTFGLMLFIIGIIMVWLSIVVPTWIGGQLDLSHVGYLNLAPGSVFKATGMFIMIKNINYEKLFKSKTEKINEDIMKFAEISFGLYLIHLLIPINWIWNINTSPFISIPLCLVFIIIVTYILLNIMNRIPLLKRFTGMKN